MITKCPARLTALLTAFLFAVGLVAPIAWPEVPDTTSWYVIETAEGDRIGFLKQTVSTGPDSREITSVQSLNVRTPGAGGKSDVRQSTRVETLSGELKSYLGPLGDILRDGRIVTLRPSDLGAAARELTLDEDILTGGDTQTIREWDFSANPVLSYRIFNPANFEVETIRVRLISDEPDESAGGLSYARMRFIDGHFSGASVYKWSKDGALVSLSQRLFDVAANWVSSSEEAALAAKDFINFVRAFRIASPYRIPSAARAGRVRYAFERPDWFDIEIAETPEQRVLTSSDRVIIDVCEACAAERQPEWDPNLSLGATAWMQSDAPELVTFARRVTSDRMTDTEKMKRLVARGHERMTGVRFDTHLSALEAFRQREGDCVESALLLAALGRAAGIPTRIASGLVYSRERYHGMANSFMPHTWVIAYTDGEWRSYDLALDEFDATHIAFIIGDGEPWQLSATNEMAGWLSLTDMNEVRTKPD